MFFCLCIKLTFHDSVGRCLSKLKTCGGCERTTLVSPTWPITMFAVLNIAVSDLGIYFFGIAARIHVGGVGYKQIVSGADTAEMGSAPNRGCLDLPQREAKKTEPRLETSGERGEGQRRGGRWKGQEEKRGVVWDAVGGHGFGEEICKRFPSPFIRVSVCQVSVASIG